MMNNTENPTKVLYIGGSGRSGSTLLERLLGQLDDFTTVGELKQIWERGFSQNQLCGCQQPFRECPFWKEVTSQALGDPAAFDVEKIKAHSMNIDRIRFIPNMLLASRQGAHTAQMDEYTRQLARIYRAVAGVAGKSVVVDASKDPSTAYLLGRTPGIRLYVVHLVRDSRAVAHSWLRKKRRPEIVDGKAYMRRHPPSRSAGEWLYRSVLFDAAPSLGGFKRQIRMRYEDLIADPSQSLDQIVQFVEEPQRDYPFLQGNTANFTVINHTVSGNPMRFQQGPMQLRLDNEWETDLNRSHKALVTALTWPLLLKYRYPIRPVNH